MYANFEGQVLGLPGVCVGLSLDNFRLPCWGTEPITNADSVTILLYEGSFMGLGGVTPYCVKGHYVDGPLAHSCLRCERIKTN